MLSPRRTHVVRGLAALIATGGLVVAGTAAADDPPPATSVSPDAAQPAPVAEVQPDQAEALRVLRRDVRPSDALPPAAEAAASSERFGRNPALARAVRTTNGTGWVVPGDGIVCLVAPDPVDGFGTTCAPTAVVAAGGLTLIQADDHEATATTLVPDGATVVLEQETGARSRVTPDNTGVTRVDASEADHLEVVTEQGRADTPLPDADEMAAGGVR